MGQTADELRADIDQRRENMSGTVEAIEDRVRPVASSNVDVTPPAAGSVRTKDAGHGRAGHEAPCDGVVRSRLGCAARRAETSRTHRRSSRERTRGAPLVAGGIAFGLGVLVALVLPETDQERRAADALEPQLTAATEAAKEAGQHTARNGEGRDSGRRRRAEAGDDGTRPRSRR